MLWASNERIKLFITHYTHTCGITKLISRLINFPRFINCNNYNTWNCGNGFKNKEFNIDTDLCRKETNSVNKNINSVNKNINCINNNKTTTHTFTHKYTYFWLSITANSILKNVTYVHGPINHGLATPFLSYRVTLSARKTRDFIRDVIIVQTPLSPPMLGFVDKVLARFNCSSLNSG